MAVCAHSLSELSTLAMPKSPSFRAPLAVQKMFRLLRSRWRMFLEWTWSSATAICTKQRITSSSPKGRPSRARSWITWYSSPRSACSMKMWRWRPSTAQSWYLMMLGWSNRRRTSTSCIAAASRAGGEGGRPLGEGGPPPAAPPPSSPPPPGGARLSRAIRLHTSRRPVPRPRTSSAVPQAPCGTPGRSRPRSGPRRGRRRGVARQEGGGEFRPWEARGPPKNFFTAFS